MTLIRFDFIGVPEFTDVGGRMLHFNWTPTKYDEAVEECSKKGARLVEIHDLATWNEVSQTLSSAALALQ